jgi:hypothetical protein
MKITLSSADTTRRKRLTAKLGQYRQRLATLQGEGKSIGEIMDVLCKIAILSFLLENSRVTREYILGNLRKEHGEDFNADIFQSAWDVIVDYVENDGKGVIRGEGLPKDPTLMKRLSSFLV